ncbi:6372_t:CDS:2 [Diversispora eburnea]|uniref:6372_t:CDS:1 n=1 Tax=Diversispora eburnea TaxID=1213867 RepID=A0A9N8WI66_9GLOM|nr:6372_t:CDS:2 [Diversispora eburnea]
MFKGDLTFISKRLNKKPICQNTLNAIHVASSKKKIEQTKNELMKIESRNVRPISRIKVIKVQDKKLIKNRESQNYRGALRPKNWKTNEKFTLNVPVSVKDEVADDVLHTYNNLVEGNIIPFIRLLKNTLSTRSWMSLLSADEPVLQAIVEMLLPLKYRIPELCLVMDGKKQKGSGRYGFLDIFIPGKGKKNNISIELKYISLAGLMGDPTRNQFGIIELGRLDKMLEKENEKFLLNQSYLYWNKEFEQIRGTTIGEILNNGKHQLKSYMNIISKGPSIDYFSSGIFDERIRITRSNYSNKLKGFIIIVIGFRQILWRPVEEIITNYRYDKV